MSHIPATFTAPVSQKVNNFVVEALTVAMLITGGFLTFVAVAAAS